ncbi:hypothetical protein [Priestia megaterium]|uniref:hypothetical protein n=1 Tax=Priestia megaterium TaxID=1404 RepID=UPI002877A9F4|nr:hypothetical protein [Priestia megaterium]
MKLNLSTKNQNPSVNYHNVSKTYQINEVKETKLAETFIQDIQKEVKAVNKKNRKIAIKILKATYMAGMITLTIANPTLAATTTTLDPSIMKEFLALMKFVVICSIVVSSALAMLLMMAAGAYRMLRKQKEATQWTTDIIKGYVQCLIAVPLISLLLYTAVKLFKNAEWFFMPF